MSIAEIVLPRVAVVDAPVGWKEDGCELAGYEHAVAITLELFGEKCSLLVDPEEADRFVGETRKLRKRSSMRLSGEDDGDCATDLCIKRLSESYVLSFQCWRSRRPSDTKPELDYTFLGEKAERGVLLSDDQMTEFLANLEHAAKEANVEYV